MSERPWLKECREPRELSVTCLCVFQLVCVLWRVGTSGSCHCRWRATKPESDLDQAASPQVRRSRAAVWAGGCRGYRLRLQHGPSFNEMTIQTVCGTPDHNSFYHYVTCELTHREIDLRPCLLGAPWRPLKDPTLTTNGLTGEEGNPKYWWTKIQHSNKQTHLWTFYLVLNANLASWRTYSHVELLLSGWGPSICHLVLFASARQRCNSSRKLLTSALCKRTVLSAGRRLTGRFRLGGKTCLVRRHSLFHSLMCGDVWVQEHVSSSAERLASRLNVKGFLVTTVV